MAIYNGTSGNDTLTGGNDGDIMNGANGHDIIYGMNGNDIISGGVGNDTIYGGNGSDTLYGGTGDDIFHLGENDNVQDIVGYVAGNGRDTVYNFIGGYGGDEIRFEDIANIDVVVLGSTVQLRVGNGIAGDSGFGTGDLLMTLSNVNMSGLTANDLIDINFTGANFSSN